MVFLCLLAAAAWSDFKTRKIPDRLVLGLLAVGVIAVFTMPGTGLASRLLGAAAVSLPLLLLACIVPGSVGGGDIKLMAAGGFFLGARLILLSFVLAMTGAGVYALVLLIFGKKGRKTRFALGPFLCAGMALALLG